MKLSEINALLFIPMPLPSRLHTQRFQNTPRPPLFPLLRLPFCPYTYQPHHPRRICADPANPRCTPRNYDSPLSRHNHVMRDRLVVTVDPKESAEAVEGGIIGGNDIG